MWELAKTTGIYSVFDLFKYFHDLRAICDMGVVKPLKS